MFISDNSLPDRINFSFPTTFQQINANYNDEGFTTQTCILDSDYSYELMDHLSNVFTEEETDVDMTITSENLEINMSDDAMEEKSKCRHKLCMIVKFLTKKNLMTL